MYIDGGNEFIRVLLIDLPVDGYINLQPGYFMGTLTVGTWYTAHLVPTIIDPITFEPSKPQYIVLCDDEGWRKVDTKHFITQAEHRDNKLNKILE